MTLSSEDAAAWCGALRWFELRLFEVLGSWVRSTPEPEVKVTFDRHSQHHAWRAEQWWDRLPLRAGVDRQALVRSVSAEQAAMVDALAAEAATVGRVVGAYRVALPHLAVAYRRLGELLVAVNDAPVIRTLQLLEPDVGRDWHEGESLAQNLLVDVAAVKAAALVVERLETVTVTASG